jgi:hypothetical protein
MMGRCPLNVCGPPAVLGGRVALTSLSLDMPNLVDMTCSHIPSSSCSAILPLYTTQSLRANYLQEIDFFANPDRHDCYSVGNNSCSRLPHCAQERNGNSCLELVNRCSDAGRTICRNGAVQMSSSSRTNQNLGLCEWSGGRNGSCTLPRNRDRTTVRVTVSSDAAPRPRSNIRLDVTDSSEDMPSLSEDYDYYEDEEGEDSEDMFSTSEDYADSY